MESSRWNWHAHVCLQWRLNTKIKIKILGGVTNLSVSVPYPGVELLALEDQEVVLGPDDAALQADGAGGVDVISGHHANGDAGFLALPDGFRHLATPTLIKWFVYTNKICHRNVNMAQIRFKAAE